MKDEKKTENDPMAGWLVITPNDVHHWPTAKMVVTDTDSALSVHSDGCNTLLAIYPTGTWVRTQRADAPFGCGHVI